jgi:hypothetical protein
MKAQNYVSILQYGRYGARLFFLREGMDIAYYHFRLIL